MEPISANFRFPKDDEPPKERTEEAIDDEDEEEASIGKVVVPDIWVFFMVYDRVGFLLPVSNV